MKTILRVLVIIIIVAGGGTAVYWYNFADRGLSEREVKVSGNIETTEVQIAFKIPGRVLTRGRVVMSGGQVRSIDEGDWVEQGQVVATLDTADLEANVALRRAELKVAEAASAALEAGSRPQEIEAAKAAWEKATAAFRDLESGSRPQEIVVAKAAVAAAAADMVRLQSNYQRISSLFQRKTVSQEEYDAAKAAYDVSMEKHRQAVEQLKLAEEGFRKEQIEQARATLVQAKWQYDLVKAGPREEDKQQGRARVQQAKAALEYAEIQLSYATVKSPIAGVVLSKNIEPGEYVAPGTPVVTIGDMKNVWLRAYIPETELGRVKVGQPAQVIIDTIRGGKSPCQGRVSFISQEAEFTPKNVQTQKERVKLVYRIKIDIVNPGWEKKQWLLKPGMPADAVIETGDRG
jgi:HlyD family secretion protein